ncbi:MAG TPA: hypothetical protein VEA69_24245 [Tepidisphaeraceae bacterium]|nr:hypothetical protein [Tepidisphaeraceae bacterium]
MNSLLTTRKSAAVACVLPLAVLAVWCYSAFVGLPPRHTPAASTYWAHGWEWRSHSVIRLRPHGIVVESWDVAKDHEIAFTTDPIVLLNNRLAADRMGGPFSWRSYAAGVGSMGKKNPRFPVTGHFTFFLSWWFLFLLASFPFWLPPLAALFRSSTDARTGPRGFPITVPVSSRSDHPL